MIPFVAFETERCSSNSLDLLEKLVFGGCQIRFKIVWHDIEGGCEGINFRRSIQIKLLKGGKRGAVNFLSHGGTHNILIIYLKLPNFSDEYMHVHTCE